MRRQYTRYRRLRRSRDPSEEERRYERYKDAKKALQKAIKRAKERARQELLATLDTDPWGRPYRMVMSYLRPWTPPASQTLEPQVLENTLGALMPQRAEFRTPFMVPPGTSQSSTMEVVPLVTEVELELAVNRLRAKQTAPGPDGIPGRVWALAMGALGTRLRRLFNACLATGKFPQQWKIGRLVLLYKQGRPVESPSAYRPIVLLNEGGKLLERIIVRRLTLHLTTVGPDLSVAQFGFREGRSTVDAVRRVKALSDDAVSQGGVLLAVSLDISNAFNTLPRECILEALKYHGVPNYLYRLVESYLDGRSVLYAGRNACMRRWQTSCGVPQGSVLGPLLWNIGYDWVLRGALLPGANVTCYADDTLVTAKGGTIRDAITLATVSVAQIVERIRSLGLKVALAKTEAICFHGPRRAPPVDTHILVDGVRVKVGSSLKYLGLVLDSRWTFISHFQNLAPKAIKCATALASLLPNLGGAGVGVRSLYTGIVCSIILYGAPVWYGSLSTGSVAILRRLQHLMVIRAIRGYRTISYEAACLLACAAPWKLVARTYADLYEWVSGRAARGIKTAPRERDRKKTLLQESLFREWLEGLDSPSAGLSTIAAIRPVFNEWVNRKHGVLTFRLVQILSGHGCFGKYLHQIPRRECTPRCHHCNDQVDTVQHTVEKCPAWTTERTELTQVIGEDLSLQAIVGAMVKEEGAWHAMAQFSESVMRQKEEAERTREKAPDAPVSRRVRPRRGGRTARGLQIQLSPP